MTLQDDLDRIALIAAERGDGDELAGVLAAEPATGGRIYLCAFRTGEAVSWLALDHAGQTVHERGRVREAASLVALCELAEECAGGGELDDLLSRLVALRVTERPEGIEEAEEAVRDLQRTLGGAPRLATPAYLDDVGVATKRLETALGGGGASPFAEAMRAGAAAVQSFAEDVEANLRRPPD